MGVAIATAACAPHAGDVGSAVSSARWCSALPRATNAAFATVDVGSTWFDVRPVEPGVFAINQPQQFQEAIAYLIVGSRRALLFDTGVGMVPIRPVVERLTLLPVTVINSHSHFDHVGGNAEFDDVWSLDTPFTRANEAGKPHAGLASEVAADAFCDAPPTGLDTAAFHSRAWKVTKRIHDGDSIDVGGRVLEILAAPGHTPDAVALLDRANGLLWTGDSYYRSTIWLFSPETDLDAYERTMTRLDSLVPQLRRLLPAHNTVSEPPTQITETLAAFRAMRRGEGTRVVEGPGQRRVTIGAVSFLVHD